MPINSAPLARKDLKLLKSLMQSVPSLSDQGWRTPAPLSPRGVHLNQETAGNLFNVFLKVFVFPPHSAVVCLPGWFSLFCLVAAVITLLSPSQTSAILSVIPTCVKAFFLTKALGILVCSPIYSRSDSMFPYTGMCMLMSEVSLDIARICQNVFLLLHSWHGRVLGSCL